MDWINVKDKLPNNHQYVLCNCNQYEAIIKKDRKYINFNIPVVSWMIGEPFNCFDIEHSGYFKVTHWIELPESPN